MQEWRRKLSISVIPKRFVKLILETLGRSPNVAARDESRASRKMRKRGANFYPTRKQWSRGSDKFPPHHIEKTIGVHAILNYIKTAGIKGSIVECGVGKGVSIYVIARITHALGMEKEIYGFDSFLGFPEPAKEDQSYRRAEKGEWGDTSIEHVVAHFMKPEEMLHYYDNFVRLVPGFFEDSMPEVSLDSICYLHLDCDLYQSYKTSIKYQYPRLSPGAVVVYDEYASENFPGAKTAVDPSLESYQRVMFFSPITKKHISVDMSTTYLESFNKLQGELQLIRV